MDFLTTQHAVLVEACILTLDFDFEVYRELVGTHSEMYCRPARALIAGAGHRLTGRPATRCVAALRVHGLAKDGG